MGGGELLTGLIFFVGYLLVRFMIPQDSPWIEQLLLGLAIGYTIVGFLPDKVRRWLRREDSGPQDGKKS